MGTPLGPLCILDCNCLKAPDEAHRPQRTRQCALSHYWIWDACKKRKVYVPKTEVYRMHSVPNTKRSEGSCLRCSRGACKGPIGKLCAVHGAPYCPLPANVVVLGARNTTDGGMVYGWFARYEPLFPGDAANSKQLWRLEPRVVEEISEVMAGDPNLCESKLLTHYPDLVTSESDAVDFLKLACLRYTRVRDNMHNEVQRELEKKGKRKRAATPLQLLEGDGSISSKCLSEWSSPPTTPPLAAISADTEVEMEELTLEDAVLSTGREDVEKITCGVCLEENCEASERLHCCGSKVCYECDQTMRGLCVVCQRQEINARYYCSCCGMLRSLRYFGYPCLHCERPNICRECYCSFGDCAECDALRV